MNGPKLGQLITTNEPRDAIHIAVAPVVANQTLKPGEPIDFAIKGNVELVDKCCMQLAVGIVDPFLTLAVLKGQCFWMYLKPNTITGLRHEWTHPAFEQETTEISKWWLRDFVEKHLPTDLDDVVEQLMESDGKYASFGQDIDYPNDEEMDKFWHHMEIYTGRKFPEANSSPFRCAC